MPAVRRQTTACEAAAFYGPLLLRLGAPEIAGDRAEING